MNAYINRIDFEIYCILAVDIDVLYVSVSVMSWSSLLELLHVLSVCLPLLYGVWT